MTRSKRFAADARPVALKLLIGVVVVQWCVGLAGGIVVRLGDGVTSFGPPDGGIGVVHILPRLLSNAAKSQRPPTSFLPLAYVVRRLPVLPARLHGPSTVAPESSRHEGARPWVDTSPLPYYPLGATPAPERNLAAFQDALKFRPLAPQRIVEEVPRPRPLPPLLPLPRLTASKVSNHLPLLPFSAPAPKKPAKESNVAGRAGIDYPTYGTIPETSFSCKDQRYKGFFGDPETGCQAWHYCDFNGGQASFLCPNGTIFSQVLFTCDWWFNVQCNSTLQLYVINERLYKYIIPMAPSFPEDYHGPEVNQYLTLKFMELMQKEQKKLKEKLKNSEKNKAPSEVNAIGSTLNDNGLINKQQLGLTNDILSLDGADEVASKNFFIPS